MIKVQTNRGVVVEVPFSELKGERRDDGRFYATLMDGSEGIWLGPEEVKKLEEEHRRGVQVLTSWVGEKHLTCMTHTFPWSLGS